MEPPSEHDLTYLLAYDGTVFIFDEGYWVKIEVRQTDATPRRPHGLSYSLTLHDPNGRRLLGFDNAHPVRPKGGSYKRRPTTHDHWHRDETDEGRPYEFRSTVQLVDDFLGEVERVLRKHGVSADAREIRGRPDE